MLPPDLEPEATYELTRLGGSADGGYLVEAASLRETTSLIGIGMSTDWSFEESFLRRRPVPVDVYDHSINRRFWRRYVAAALGHALLFTGEPARVAERFSKYRSYRRFFRHKVRHFEERVGTASSGATSLTTALKRRLGTGPVFMKIDIEGDEYEILGELHDHASALCGLVIEFHDVPHRLDRIRRFVHDLPLSLVHIHPNNFGGFDDHSTPRVVELSFARNPKPVRPEPTIPHPLDCPNHPKLPDPPLAFRARDAATS